jgi:hypothetical protein
MKKFLAAVFAVACMTVLGGAAMAQSPNDYWVIENQSDQLFRVDVVTRNATLVGSLGVDWQFGGLGFAPNGTLFGWNTGNNSLYNINKVTGAATLVGAGSAGGMDSFDINQVNGRGFGVSVSNGNTVEEVNLATGATSTIANTSPSTFPTGTAFSPNGTWFGIDGVSGGNLFTVDPLSGTVTTIGPLGTNVNRTNLGFNAVDSFIYFIEIQNANSPLWQVNPATGAATLMGNVTGLPNDAAQQITAGTFQFSSVPEPTTLALAGLAASSMGATLWRRRTKRAPKHLR